MIAVNGVALVAILVAGLGATSGCGAVRAANARSNVHQQFGCSDAAVEDLGRRRLRVRGCGRTALYYCAAQWVQCLNIATIVRQRASVELSCPYDAWRVRELEPNVLHVSGCGVGTSYVCGVRTDGSPSCRAAPAVQGGFSTRPS